MTVAPRQSAKLTFHLTEEEREVLLGFLNQALREKLREEHRTEAHKFREMIQHEEEILQSLIQKLQGT